MASEELMFLHRHRDAVLRRWKEHIRQSVNPDFFGGESLVTDDLLGALFGFVLDALDLNHFHELNRTFDALTDRGYARFISISDVTGLLFGFIIATEAVLEHEGPNTPQYEYLCKALGRFHADLRKVYSERIGRQAAEALRHHREHVLTKWQRDLPTEAVSTHFTVLGRREIVDFTVHTFEIATEILMGNEESKAQALDGTGQPKSRLQEYLDTQIDYLEPRGFAISDIERAILHLQEIAEPIFFAELHHEAAAYRKALWVLSSGVKRLALEFSEHYNQRMMNNYYEEVSKMLHRIKNKITPAQSGLQTILPQVFEGREQEGMVLTAEEGAALEEMLIPLVRVVELAEPIIEKLGDGSQAEAVAELTAARDAFAAAEATIQAAIGKLSLIEIVEEFIRDALEAAELSTSLAKDLQEVQNELIRREPPVWESICINDLVQRAFDESQVDAKLKGLEYLLSADTEHARVFGVLRQLTQPFAQVINNAIKYTPASASTTNGDAPEDDGLEHRVTVTLTIEEDSILFACQDSGIGIPLGEEELVFALCERCSNAKEFNKHGSGTGLYQDRKIIEQHNGRIWVESAGQNQGSTFYIRLPRYHGEVEEAAAAQ